MAVYYDCVYDWISLYGILSGLSGWIDSRVYMMYIQLLIAILLGVLSLLYLYTKIKQQFTQIEKDSICEDCTVPDKQLLNNKK